MLEGSVVLFRLLQALFLDVVESRKALDVRDLWEDIEAANALNMVSRLCIQNIADLHLD